MRQIATQGHIMRALDAMSSATLSTRTAQRWLRGMALPIRDESGRITRWFGTSTDVHESYQVAQERERLAQELERVATVDQLTGVLTRRAFTARVNAHLEETAAPDEEASLLMLDIDHFKSINDTHGHPTGDQVLAATAERMRAAVRAEDFIGRLGGEAFAVFMPQCPRSQAWEIAERIRRSVGEQPIRAEDGREIQVTVSIGATPLMQGSASFEQLVSSADRALYAAKSSGRNRVLFAAQR